MTDITIAVQSTPNPHALKFVLPRTVKAEGKISYRQASECGENTLAQKLFEIDHVCELHFFQNAITVSQDGQGDWDVLEEQVKKTIEDNIAKHNPDFKTGAQKTKSTLPPELEKIDAILDQTVRPYLQNDGGDLQLISLEGHTLTVSYQGACGSCPMAITGTLRAIEGILKDQFDPDIEVVPVQ